jgi:hypothetical protein
VEVALAMAAPKFTKWHMCFDGRYRHPRSASPAEDRIDRSHNDSPWQTRVDADS